MKRSAFKKLSSYAPSSDSSKLVKIGQASELLGVSIDTLRRWEKKGWLRVTKTPGGTRLYDREQLIKLNPNLKRGPKTFISPVSPIVKSPSNREIKEGISATAPSTTTSIPQTNTNYIFTAPSMPTISLSTDRSILKTAPASLSAETIENEINETEEAEIKLAKQNLMADLFNPFSALKPSLISGALTVIVISLLMIPAIFLTNYVKNTQKESFLGVKYYNIPLNDAAKALGKLSGVFSPTLSHRFFGTYPAGSPPGNIADLNNRVHDQLASGRVSGDLKGAKIPVATGQVLAESTGSGTFLQINLDTELNGNLAVDGEGFFTGPVTAPNLVYGITAGENIEITGDPQNPTISATGIAETDTLQSVTARGATTTIASTFTGGLTASSITTSALNLTGALNLGQLASDPSGVNGATYYNTASNKFRCYINGSWSDCDTNTPAGSSFDGLTLAGETGTNEDLESGDIITIQGGNGVDTDVSATDTLTITLDTTTTGTTSTFQSNSGLEVNTDGISMLRGCSDLQVLRWDDNDEVWECAAAVSAAIIRVEEGNGAQFSNNNIDALDYLAGDFDLSLDGISEVDVQLAATLQSVTGVAGSFDVATSLTAGTANAFTVSTAGALSTPTITATPSTAQAITINQYGTAAGETGELRFMEGGASSTQYVGFKAPDSLTTNAVYTLPNHDSVAPIADYVLTWQTGNILQWKEVGGVGGVGDITSVGNVTSGPAFTNGTGDGNTGNTLYFEGTTVDNLEIAVTGADTSFDETITLQALSGAFLIIQPTSNSADTAQSASGTTSLIHVNETGGSTPNLLELEVGGTDTFVVSNGGNVDLSGTITAGSGNEVITLSTGKIDADAIGLTSATNGLTGTSSASGLATYSDTLSLLQGCADGQVLKWNEATDTWDCANDTGAAAAVVNIENNDSAVGTSVDTIDFSTDFSVTASPSSEANVSIADDILDFTEFQDTLDLDTNLSLVQGTNTWSQTFAGLATDGLTYTASSLTTGSAFVVNTTSTPTGAASTSNGVEFNLTQSADTNATTYTGFSLNFTNNPTVAGNTEYAFQIQNQATSNTTDNAVAALLRLDNADTTGTGTTVVTDAILITDSGGAGFTNFLNTPTLDISAAGAISGVTGYTQSSGAFAFSGGGNFSVDSAAFDVTTGGAISGVTGYTQTSGALAFSGGGNFSVDSAAFDVTTAGAISGVTTFSLSGAISDSDSAVNINDDLDVVQGLTVGGGAGSTGVTVTSAGAISVDGLATFSGGTTTSRTLSADSGTTVNVANITYTSPADTTGTNVSQGLNITPTIGNASGGTNTANIFNIGDVTGDAQVSLNAIKIGNLTGTGATENALVIGSGWDNDIYFEKGSNDVLFRVTAPGQATTITLPDAGAASADICLSIGNCAGAGDGVTATGTQNAGEIAFFTADDVLDGDADFVWDNSAKTLTVNGASSFTDTNAAGGSLNSVTVSGTLGAFNGSDTFRGLYLNLTNADHSGASNVFNAIDIAAITGDAQAVETAFLVGSGWDMILDSSTIDISGAGAISGITGYTQSSGDFSYSNASGNFSVDSDAFDVSDSGAISGVTTLSLSGNISDTDSAVTVADDLTVTGTSLLATSATTITLGSTGADTIILGNAGADTITIGDSASTGVSITDNNWSITTGGVASFTDLTVALTDGATINFDGDASPTADILHLGSGDTSATDDLDQLFITSNVSGVSGSAIHVDPDWTDSADGDDTYSVFSVDAFTAVINDAGNTNTLNGLVFGNLTQTETAGTITATALNIGTGWDSILSYNGTTVINGSGQVVTTQLSGTLFTITDGSTPQTIVQGDTLTYADSTTINAATSATDTVTMNVIADSIGDTQLAFNTGQHLTTSSSPSFDNLTLTGADITGANSAAIDIGEAVSGDISFTGDLILAEDAFIGLSSSTVRLAFDSTPTPDEIDVLDGNLDLNNNLILNIGAAGTDFTTGGGLTLAELLTVNDDLNVALDDGDTANIDGDGSPTADTLHLGSGDTSATDDVDQLFITTNLNGVSGSSIHIDPDWTDSADGNDTYNVFSVDAFTAVIDDTGNTNTLNGLFLGNLTQTETNGTITASALNIGSGWDNDIYFEKGSSTDVILRVTAASGGDRTLTVPQISSNDEFCIKALANCFGSGSGGVSATGTQNANEIAYFTGDDNIDGDSSFTFNQSTGALALTGNSTVTFSAVSGSASTINLTQSDDGDASDTSHGLNIALTSSSGDADTLNAINVATITGGNATETGLRIGDGFDNDIVFEHSGSTDVILRVTAASGGDRIATIPQLSADDTICFLTLANCAGAGGGITGSGTDKQIAFFNGSGTITSESAGFGWDYDTNQLTIAGLTGVTSATTATITSSSNSITSGGLLSTALTSSGITADFSGDITALASTRTLTAAATRTDTGNVLDLSRTSVANNGSGTYNVQGAILNISNTATQTAGTLADSANLVAITQDADATGASLYINSNRTGSNNAILVEQSSGGTDIFSLTDAGNAVFLGDITVTSGDITGSNSETLDIGEADNGSFLFAAAGETNNNSIELDLETNAFPTWESATATSIGIDEDLQFVGAQSITTSAGNLTINSAGTTVLADAVTAQGQFTFSNIATDITTGTDEALTIAPNGTGDVVIDTDSDTTLTLNGGGDGVDSLVLTDGDILLTDGDLDLSGGDFNVTLDAADEVDITKTAAAAATEEGLDLTFTAGAGDGSDVYSALRIAATSANHSASTDRVYGIHLTNLASADAEGLEYGIFQAGTGWDYGIYAEDLVGIDNDIEFIGSQSILTTSNGNLTIDPNGSGDIVLTAETGANSEIWVNGLNSGTGSALCVDTASNNRLVTCTVGSGGLSGSGTDKQIAFFNGTSNVISESAFGWDYDTNQLTIAGLTTATTAVTASITSANNGLTSGGLFSSALTSSGVTAAFTGNVGSFSANRTYTGASTLTDTSAGNVLELTRTTENTNASGTFNIQGAILNITNTVTPTAGTLTDSSNLVEITQDAQGTGALLYLNANRSSTSDTILIEQSSGGTDIFRLQDNGNLAINGDLTVTGGDITGTGNESIDIGEASADTITFLIDAAAEARISGSALFPTTAEGNALGTTSGEWEALYVGDDNGVFFGLDQDFTLAYDEATDDRLEMVSTNKEFSIALGNQDVVIAGSADGTAALTVTAGDLTVTNGDLTVTAGDFNVGLDDADSANIDGDGSPTADTLVLGNGDTSATDNVDQLFIASNVSGVSGSAIHIDPDWTDSADGNDTYNIFEVDAFTAVIDDTGNTNTLNGLVFGNLTQTETNGTITASAINIGTGWDADINATTSLDVAIGGTAELSLSATNLNPGADGGNSLGASGTEWQNLFLNTGAVINFEAGDVTLTHSSNTLTLAGGDIDAGNNLILNIGAAGTDFTAGGGLTLAEALVVNDDATFTLAAGEKVLIDASSTASTGTAGALDVDLASTSSQSGVDISAAITDDNATDTVAGLKVTGTQNSDDGDNLYGIQVLNLAGAASSGNEYAIYQAGTGWDLGLYVEDAARFNTTLEVYGNTIGLNNDADADNLLGVSAAAGAAGSDLYWGDKLLCTAASTDCGWLGSASSPWTTDSNVVNLVTDGDTVTIGSNTALGKLAVDGDADEIQLLIQGNATQTSNLVVFETSAGTDLFTLTNAGAGMFLTDLTVTGGDLIGANSDRIDIAEAADATFTFTRNDSGTVTLTSADDDSDAALTVAAGGSGALTLGDTGSASTLTGTTIALTASGAGNDINANLVDNNTDALDIQESTNNYININTTNSSENISFGNATTNPTFSFLGTSAVTIAGSGDGTNALVLTLGDIEVTNGDLDVVAGDFNVGLDSADEVDITKTSAAAATEEGIDLTFTAGAGDGSDVYSGFRIAATSANHSASSDKLYGINIANLASADAEGAESAMFVGTGWDDILNYNGTTVINGTGQIVGAQVTDDSLDFAQFQDVMDVDAATDINLGTFALTIDMDSTGDFSVRDGTTDILAFTDSGAITATPTSGQNFGVTTASTGDILLNSGDTLLLDSAGVLELNSSAGAINIGNDAVAQAINIGTGAAARTITIGNATGATALAFNSGTGAQTFTSLVDSGTTTTSAFVFDAAEIKAGTGMYVTADELTTGKLAQFATTGNTLTTGTLVDIRSTATSLTGTAGVGSMANIDWSPGSATTATGDLFAINIGTNGTTTGNLFNILDTGSSIFSVSETQFTTSLPSNFTSAGDVSIANDIQFTNPTASYIKSYSALNLVAGDPFGSSNLSGQVYNAGSIVFESISSAHTGTSGLVDINVNSSTSENIGLNIDYIEDSGASSGADLYASKISLTQNDTDGDLFGLDINSALQSGTTGSIDALLRLRQLDTTASNTTTLDNAIYIDSAASSGMTNGIQIAGSAGTIANGLLIADGSGAITDGIEMTGTFTNLINTPNFDVDNAGNITVAAAEGLDTNGAGALEVGFTNATSVLIGTTAATTLNLGAGGALTRTINIGTGTGVDTINIGNGGTGADLITIGSSNAGASSFISGAALTLTAGATSTWSASSGNLTLHANSNTANLFLSGGDTLPSSVADGNDIELKAEDDIFLNPTDDVRLYVNGAAIDCSGSANGGVLTTDVNGIIQCGDDNDSGGTATTLQTAYDNDVNGSDALITLNTTDGSLVIRPIAATNFQVEQVTSAPTLDMVSITNSGLGTTTNGVDGLSLVFVTGDGTDPTNNGINVALTSGGTAATDIANAINLSLTSTAGGTDRGLNIGSGFDTSINLTQSAASQAIVIDAATTDNTVTTGVFDLNVDTVTNNNVGSNIDYIIRDSTGISGYAQNINVTIDNDGGHDSTGYGLRIIGDSEDAGSTFYGLFIDADNDGNGEGTEIALETQDGLVRFGNGTDYAQLSSVGDITFVDANDGASITGPAGGIFTLSSNLASGQTTTEAIRLTTANDLGSADEVFQIGDNGTSSNFLTILGNGNVGIGDVSPSQLFSVGNGDLFTVDSTGDVVLAQATPTMTFDDTSGDDFSLNLDASSFTLRNTTDGRDDLTVSGTGGFTINGGAVGEGTSSLTVTSGNITLTDGDLTVSSGELSVTTDDTSGTAFLLNADTMQTGIGMDLSLDGLTTGTGLLLDDNTAAGLSTGSMFRINSISSAFAETTTTGEGLLADFNWNPGSASTTGTGDLFRIRIDDNGTLTSGALFNIVDESTSIFSVKETAFETSLPSNFTAPGDIAIAYDINFTNPTASYIKSAAPMYIAAGETFGSSNLVLQTYNSGSVVVDGNGDVGTSTGGLFQVINASSSVTGTTTTALNVAGAYVNTTDIDTISLLVRNSNTGAVTMANVGTSGAQGDPGVLTVEGIGSSTTAYNLITAYNSTTRSDAAAVFRVRADGNVYGEAAFNSSGADYAEYFPTTDQSIDSGDLVIIDPNNNNSVAKASSEYNKALVGIISTRPGFIGNNISSELENHSNYKLVGIAGQVPTKVSTINGSIKKGDSITSSSIPGVAMKATRSGQIIGKALEDYNGTGIGKIQVFINATYADPSDALANLLIGTDGSLTGNNITAEKITVSGDIKVGGLVKASEFALDASKLNLTTALASVYVDSEGKSSLSDIVNTLASQLSETDQKLAGLETTQASQSEELAQAKILGEQAVSHAQTLDDKVASTSANITSLSSRIDDLLASLGNDSEESSPSSPLPEGEGQGEGDELDLTPPNVLFATGSATLANLNVTESLSTLNLEAIDATISGTFKSLGDSFLGNTVVAGDFSVDGTLSLTGNSINSIACDNNETMEQCNNGVLFIQNSALATTVDFFNGLVTISKEGVVEAKEFIAEQITVKADTSAGTIVIPAGEVEIPVLNALVKTDSIIILTSETAGAPNLAVSAKVEDSGFIVTMNAPFINDVKFSYLIVGQKEAEEASN